MPFVFPFENAQRALQALFGARPAGGVVYSTSHSTAAYTRYFYNPPPHPLCLAGVVDTDKIRLLDFTTLHDSRRSADDATQFRDAWIPHTQTQRHGELAMVKTPL